MSVERHFTIEQSDIGFVGGYYKGSSPVSAGRKAGHMLFKVAKYGKLYKEDSNKYARYAKYEKFAGFASKQKLRFVVRETTADSKKKSFTYEVSQEKLKDPIIVKRGDVEIKIERKFAIKACKA